VLGWTNRWTADDAFFNFRVVDNILDGNGPVFNAGERVEIYTSALWLAVLTVVHGVLRMTAPDLEPHVRDYGRLLDALTGDRLDLARAAAAARLNGDLDSLVLPAGAAATSKAASGGAGGP